MHVGAQVCLATFKGETVSPDRVVGDMTLMVKGQCEQDLQSYKMSDRVSKWNTEQLT